MRRRTPLRLVTTGSTLGLLSFLACNRAAIPTTPAPPQNLVAMVSPPTIVSPSAGSQTMQSTPTLTVSNAIVKDGTVPSYTFQVASDSGFGNVLAQSQGVAQGASGRTAWQVPAALESNRYFWRAKATAGAIEGPYSAVADFRVMRDAGNPGGALIYDPLTNGASVGDRQGGQFTSGGWRVTRVSDYIRYDVATLSNGYVEWQNTGLSRQNRAPNNYMLFGMWDPTQGPYRENAYRVHLQKLDTNNNPPYVRLRFIANAEQHDAGTNFLDWSPTQTYSWRIEWGPDGGSNLVRVLLDGQAIIAERYTRTYAPRTHLIELGIAERSESVVDAVYKNVRIGAR